MLNAERRREVCFHEAGHAIVHALGGAMIHRLAVAPEGATEPEIWTKVTNLAERLEEIGDMAEELDEFLPEPLADWPPAPPARKQQRIG